MRLQTHIAAVDDACIGVSHPEMGKELKALVMPTDTALPPDPQPLVDWCRERLSHYKFPRTLDLVDDLGRTAMDKINKRNLRAPLLAVDCVSKTTRVNAP